MSRAKSARGKKGLHKKLPDGRWITVGASPYRQFWPIVATMPSLSHWPNREEPFDYAKSEIIRFIMAQCGVPLNVAVRVWNSVRINDVIKFDPELRLWSGVGGGRS